MTPFGELLEKHRRKRGLHQQELSYLVGINSTYVSAMESGKRGSPSKEVVQRIIAALELTEQEAKELKESATRSKKSMRIPNNASSEEYLIAYQLFQRMGRLSHGQLAIIREAINLNE